MATNLEQCPLCGSELSQAKSREIRAKLRAEEDKRAEEIAAAKAAMKQSMEQELRRQLSEERRSIERKVRDEAAQLLKKATLEKEELATKLKNSEARAAEIQSKAQAEIEKAKLAAEKKAKLDAKREHDQQIVKLRADRDLATKQLHQAKEREAQVREQTQAQAQKEAQEQLQEQREVLEKAKTTSLLRQQAEFNRDRDSLQKKVKTLEHQLEKKTANELGDGAEIDVFEALRDAFQGDKITRIQKGQWGADILHEVLYKGECCGRIVTDSKNRQSWQNAFVSKLRQDKVEANAEQAILATTVFPAGKKELCIESGIIVVSPARVVYVTELLRQAMITMHVKGLSLKERSDKMSRLYSLITSESYRKKFGEADRLTQDILDLDVQEQKDHRNVWLRRGTLGTRLKNVLREVETEVAAVIEADGEAPAQRLASQTVASAV